MDKREKDASKSEDASGKEQNAPWSQQPTQIDSERPDEHERRVIRTVKPSAVVETYAYMTLQIGKAETEHSAGQSNESRSYDDSQDSKQRPRRDFRRNGRGGTARDLSCGRTNDYARSGHRCPLPSRPDGGDDGESGS